MSVITTKSLERTRFSHLLREAVGRAICVVGLQWGDEGKGKFSDLLAAWFDFLHGARFNGAGNAGHTVVVDGKTYHVHSAPSTIVHPEGQALLGAGELINPVGLLWELFSLGRAGLNVENRVTIDPRSTLITVMDLIEDAARDQIRAAQTGKPIGTTWSGIGPAYAGFSQRADVRVVDLLSPLWEERLMSYLEARLEILRGGLKLSALDIQTFLLALTEMNRERNADIVDSLASVPPTMFDFSKLSGSNGLNLKKVADFYAWYAERLLQLVKVDDVGNSVLGLIGQNCPVQLEAAQGAMLDVRWGSSPFTTSSHTTAGGACIGLGLPPRAIGPVIGIAKLAPSKVGGGPNPTRDNEGLASIRGKKGEPDAEYGATTGRERQLGWLDTVVLRHTIRTTGTTMLGLSKLDKLSGLPELKVCVAYEIDGRQQRTMPADISDLERAKPVYFTLKGWNEDITGVTEWDNLPPNAQKYCGVVTALSQPDIPGYPEIPLCLIGTGPDREHVIVL